ncbi:hypothetical protein V5799_020183 [Amblyomma americanum]|uniref:Secreted protein n=1 Tax=Amblyomma americanum TaxID=6943 RepID=A0AAQ4EV55_AMBAM
MSSTRSAFCCASIHLMASCLSAPVMPDAVEGTAQVAQAAHTVLLIHCTASLKTTLHPLAIFGSVTAEL